MSKALTSMITGGLASGIVMASFASPALAETASWTMTTTWPDNIELIEFDRHWVETVDRIAGDELEIKFFAGGTLMPGNEVFDATETGSIDAAGDWPGYWAGRSPAFSPLATTTSLFNGADYLNWIFEWGGYEIYQEIYGQYNLVYLPYAVTNNESGFRGSTPIESLADLEGKRLRMAGRDQGRVLEKLGGSQVTLAGGEIYQAIERGVVDGAEFSTAAVDYAAGFSEVADYWATPGWHQTASVYGVMINKDSWDALSDSTQEKLKVAAQATMAWSLPYSERRNTEATQTFIDDGVEITRFSDEDLTRIQDITNEVMVTSACEDPQVAKIYHSMIRYMTEYASWRDITAPYSTGRANDNLPDLEAIEACL